jgi:DnaJ like chaperone protein
LLGATLGHNFDRGVNGLQGGMGGVDPGETERVQSAFFTATFSIMGHIAKADGRVSEQEIQVARHIMAQMQLNSAQQQAAMKLFEEGKRAGFPLHEVLDQFKFECQRRRTLVQMFMEIQIATVLADGEVHPSEHGLLLEIGVALGFGRHHIDQLIQMAQAQQRYAGGTGGGRSQQASGPSLKDAYAVLGVESSTSDTEVKRAYRRLMSQHHPDKLVAKGLPEEMMKIATQKTQEIKAAYEQVKKARG